MNHIELPARPGAYRWYYVDVTAGDSTAVFIFMIGSIFSARYSTAVRKGGLPREHAAVNFALYEKGVRTRWVLTEYGDVGVSEDARELRIGRSWLRYEEGGLRAEILDKTTPFMATGWGRPTRVSLALVPEGPTHGELELVPGLSHRWRPIAARARATVRLEDGLVLEGRGYHDGNHGDVPLGSDLRGWDWVRTHGALETSVLYRPWSDTPGWNVTVSAREARAVAAPPPAQPPGRTSWGLPLPQVTGAPSPMLLESSPFYARYEASPPGVSALGEVADFKRFHSPTVRWMANFKTRHAGAA